MFLLTSVMFWGLCSSIVFAVSFVLLDGAAEAIDDISMSSRLECAPALCSAQLCVP